MSIPGNKDQRWRTIMEWFDSASALPPQERPSFLAGMPCDEETKHEVMELLAQLEGLSDAPVPTLPEKNTRIGRYIILEKLAAGGMGNIFSARDTELDRTVALKFLDTDGLGGRSAVARVIREAKVLSALNHPNIVTVHEIIQTDDRCAIVMELVEGIIFRPDPPDPFAASRVISAGHQIARALEAAHAQGIIHRDIKPENILLRHDGYIKVLDFGIARRINSQTQTTGLGLPVGTVRYMSPEQSRGEHLDGATDIFSLGTVLYEASTGRHPFRKSSIFETALSIAEDNPLPPSMLKAAVPQPFEALLLRMLEKTPSARPTAAEVASALSDLGASGNHSEIKPHMPLIDRGTMSRFLSRRWMLGSVLTGLGAAGLYLKYRHVPAKGPVVWLTSGGYAQDPSFSPDGSKIVFSWKRPDSKNFQLYVIETNGGEPRPLTLSPASDTDPVWSPDGERICFVREGLGDSAMYVILVRTGEEKRITTLINSANSGRLGWLADSQTVVLAEQWFDMPLALVDTQSGKRRQLLPPMPSGYARPRRSPDGQWIAVTKYFSQTTADIVIVPAIGGAERRLTFDNNDKRYHCWTPDGLGIVFRARVVDGYGLWYVPWKGGTPRRIQSAMIPDGSFDIKKSHESGNSFTASQGIRKTAICRMEIPDTGQGPPTPTSLIDSGGRSALDADPAISPDGLRIAFISTRSRSPEIWTTSNEGSGAEQITNFGSGEVSQPAWSPDGHSVISAAALNGGRNLFVVDVATKTLRWLTQGGTEETEPQWSRDGRWIIFASSRSGRQELWRMPTAGGSAQQLTRNGGSVCRESPDGHWIYYVIHERPGLWRIPAEGGSETLVLDRVYSELYRAWAIGRQGVYYTSPRGSNRWSVDLLELDSRRERRLANLDKALPRWSGALALSPDERWMLLPLQLEQGSNLLLVPDIRL
jgi:eukaryotic-like serine/threonine-protein kinase